MIGIRKAVRGLPQRLPLLHVVGPLEDPVRQQRGTKPHPRGALQLGHRGGNVLERQVDTGRNTVEVGTPVIGQPVVGHLAVRSVGIGRNPVRHIGDPPDQHRAVDTVALQIGELLGGVQTEVGLADYVALGTRRVGLDVRRTFAGHHGQRHDMSGPVDVVAVLVLLDAREVFPVMLRQLVHYRQWRGDVAVGRDELVQAPWRLLLLGLKYYECLAC